MPEQPLWGGSSFFQVPIHRADPPTPDSLPLKPNPLWEVECSQTCFQFYFTTSCVGASGESLKLCFFSSKAGPTDSPGQALALGVPRGPTERGQTFVLAWLGHHLLAHPHLSFLQDSAPQETPLAAGPGPQDPPFGVLLGWVCPGTFARETEAPGGQGLLWNLAFRQWWKSLYR